MELTQEEVLHITQRRQAAAVEQAYADGVTAVGDMLLREMPWSEQRDKLVMKINAMVLAGRN